MSEFTCPKCQAAMRSYERNGVTIEQCTDCRGVFLDRGELDRMIDAESRQFEQPVAVTNAPYRDGDKRYDDKNYGHKKKKRGGFLSELFED